MSYLGLDAGTNAIKAAVCAEGRQLASARVELDTAIGRRGRTELDPRRSWVAASDAIRAVATHDAVRADPPRALAISAGGDEVVPVDAHGDPLGPCLLSADGRGRRIPGEVHAGEDTGSHAASVKPRRQPPDPIVDHEAARGMGVAAEAVARRVLRG